MTNRVGASCSNQSGIALVVVLGFLSVLVVVGLGFAVSMRVERLISRSALDLIKSRQLVEASLVRALEDIDEDVGAALIPDRSANWAGGAFESLGSGPPVGPSVIFSGHITNYVPGSLYAGAQAAAANATWIPVVFSNQTIGRYAYIALDCSGLIDVNMDYSATNNRPALRHFGRSPYELQLNNSLLSEVSATATHWTNLIWCRLDVNGATDEDPWTRLETHAEIGPMLSRGFNGRQPLAPVDVRPVNLFTYSRAPAGSLSNGSVSQQVWLGATEAELVAQESVITNELIRMGMTATQARDTFYSLRNYVDADDIVQPPSALDSLVSEAVPLINEIAVSNRVSEGGGVTTNEYQIMVEVWYPFTGTNSSSYDVRVRSSYRDASPAALNTPNNSQTINLPAGSWTYNRLAVATTSVIRTTTTGSVDLSSAYVLINASVLRGGTEVDRVGAAAATIMRIDIGEVMTPTVGDFMRGRAANDPRLNWNGADGSQWTDRLTSQLTLGRTNNTMSLTSAGADGHNLMYVANRALQSVGELGLLPYDGTRPWRTISLLDGSNYFPVLDRFTLVTNTVRYGLINPNSYNENVTATVFYDMPVERVPYDPQTIRLTAPQARALAQRFSSRQFGITNLSDMRFIGSQVGAAINTVNSNAYDSIVRNSAGLFTPRQQLFTVLLAAQVLQVNTTNVLAEQRGVGLVWRDPYPVGGRHEIRVRNFRWLTE